MKKISCFFLFLLICFGCSDESSNQDETVKDDIIVKTGPEKEIVWEKDGKEMVLIPAGSFEMGDHFSEGKEVELPVHTVTLDAFYMDTHEVTVGQFKQFVNQTGYSYDRWNNVAKYSPGDDYSMIYVTWDDATAYAEWAGKRLPTEAEWEYAARGGLTGKRYSWGDDISFSRDYANHDRIFGKDKWQYTSPVGSFDPNGYGLYDMTGNVWEWCQDRYADYNNSPVNNPSGPSTGLFRVLRGGSWRTAPYFLRLAYRTGNAPIHKYYDHGFRCVSGSD